MRAAMRLRHVRQATQSDRDARADVVAERDGAHEAGPINTELFAYGKCRRNDGAARMRLRERMGVVGFVGMSQHTVRQRRLNRPAQDVRCSNGRDLLAFVSASEL